MKNIEFPFDINRFFKKCVDNKNFPKNDFEKQAVLLCILKEFKDRIYVEEEVNNIIKKYFTDYALIRREMINFGYPSRNPYIGEYKVIKRTLTDEDIKNNTLLRRHAEAFKVLDDDR